MSEKKSYCLKVPTLDVECPSCKAEKGGKCQSPSGTPEPFPHKARMRHALMVYAHQTKKFRYLVKTKTAPPWLKTIEGAVVGASLGRLLEMRGKLIKLQVEHPQHVLEIGTGVAKLNERIQAKRRHRQDLFFRCFYDAARTMLPKEDLAEIERTAQAEERRRLGLRDSTPEHQPIAFDPELLYRDYGKQEVLDAYSLACQQGNRPETAVEMRRILGAPRFTAST